MLTDKVVVLRDGFVTFPPSRTWSKSLRKALLRHGFLLNCYSVFDNSPDWLRTRTVVERVRARGKSVESLGDLKHQDRFMKVSFDSLWRFANPCPQPHLRRATHLIKPNFVYPSSLITQPLFYSHALILQ